MQHTGSKRRRAALLAWFLGSCAAGWSATLPAATFPSLYTVTVDVDPDAPDPEAAAMQTAMGRLLIRVTGKREAAFDPELTPLIDAPRNYVQSFGQPDAGKMQIGFIESDVDSELRALSWPVWGEERPMTLLWLAVDLGDGERAILSANGRQPEWSQAMAEYMENLQTELERVADERGLPLTLPLMDLQDLTAISFAEVWGGFDSQIRAASDRYRPDAVLVGRLGVNPFGTRAQWTLLRGGGRQVAVGSSLGDGLNWVADRYADEYSVLGGARTARIEVLGVQSLADYGRVLSYLERLSVLQSVDVEGFDGNVLNLRVTTRGDQSVLERVLTLGAVLTPAGEAASGSALTNGLRFRIARSGG
jgi:hypothetical protein